MKVYGISSLIEAVLLFYLIISTIKEIQFGEYARRTTDLNTIAVYNTYAMNSALAGLGAFGFVISLIAGILSLVFTDCYSDSRVNIA